MQIARRRILVLQHLKSEEKWYRTKKEEYERLYAALLKIQNTNREIQWRINSI